MLTGIQLRAVATAVVVAVVSLVVVAGIEATALFARTHLPDSVLTVFVVRFGRHVAGGLLALVLLPLVGALLLAPEFTVVGVLRFLTSPQYVDLLRFGAPAFVLFGLLLVVGVGKKTLGLDG
ncbi:hypothetical protein SAMN04487948_10934 [Halogranum amylolyticum]|uniref:Uncharacterized protein n=1 Tax=Halogranum amylolyticum TaxID=660520 RepID=A0A1H8TZS2_9EURY|nr:hypothetical protein [Halogranum amylolyticum]SEO96510.1 hypothetical protein SAMN04487948_10934 [Halogranum amylolyticum]